MYNNILKEAKKLHFVGIGGSGTFPIVQIFNKWGYEITGSDNNTGDTIDKEREMGITVTLGHAAENVGSVDAVVYSAAIPDNNPELVYACENNIPLVTRAEALHYITQKYSSCIGVSGTHGKTTTTALLTQVLLGAGLDPTAVIGGKLPAIDGYGRAGNSNIMTCEACEYKDTYLSLDVDIAVILNVDEDHLEYFKNLDNIIASFNKFAKKATKAVIVNGDDLNSMKSVHDVDVPIITFGLNSHNNFYASNIQQVSPIVTTFDVYNNGEMLATMSTSIPGDHNLYNALAAIAAALYVGATVESVAEYLPQFKGAGRRFEILGIHNGVHIADDYAHHPKEIAATLKVAKTMGFGKVWAVFQPFTYSRTSILMDDFAEALSHADHVVMSDIMGGREENTYGVTTGDLQEKIEGSVWIHDFPEIAKYVMENAKNNDLVITLGCGDVYKCARMMFEY